ncbi:phage tail fiber protein [Klebsiella pneumoniae]|nr:phage tail fiber protein [Klebsiella pneumoniae]WKI51174.1 phage tail fiber protein [Klebsiella pneumoniae]
MSVPNQTHYNIYTANGLSTVFAYEFYLISASDIQVTINGSIVTSGYTVSGVGNIDGGDITFLTPPANTSVVLLERVVPTYRLTDYQDNGDLLADTVNKDFDRLWMAIQRAFFDLGFALTRPFFGGPFNAKGYRIENLGDPVNDQDAATKKFVIATGKINLARTLRVPENSVDELPSVTARRNSLLGWNSWGKPVPIFAMTETADLAIKLASSENGLGDTLVTHVQGDIFTGSVREFLNSTIKYVTPELMGYKASNASDDNAAAILEALTVARENNLVCIFQNGTYNSNDLEVNFPVAIEVSANSFLNFALVVKGKQFTDKRTVSTTLPWSSVPVGTTSIAGDFSAFTVGGYAVVKLNDSVGGSYGKGNETGIDVSTITAKSASSITLGTATRLTYQSPDVVELQAATQYSGTLSADDYLIPGDYTKLFSAGDIIRIENIDGNDAVEADTFYFELAKVHSISSAGIVLKARLNYTHVNPWIIRTSAVPGVRIYGGGRIKRLEIRQCDSPREGANKQVISSQADSLIKISRIWADFFPANTSNQPI